MIQSHNATIAGRKHRESLSESRANIFQSSVLIGGRPGFKWPESKSGREWVWVVSYTCQFVLRDNLPHDLQSFHLWHRVFLPSPSNHGPAKALRSGEQCPGPAVLRLEEMGWFSCRTKRRLTCPCLVALRLCTYSLNGDQIAKTDQKWCFLVILSSCDGQAYKQLVSSGCIYASLLVVIRREQTSPSLSTYCASVLTAEQC